MQRKIPTEIKPAIDSILAIFKRDEYRGGIEKARLFGSFARGDFSLHSDIDLSIELSSRHNIKWGELCDTIRENIRSLRGLDIVDFNRAHSELKKKILKEGVLFYEQV